MKKVLVLFGGPSVEHLISCKSAKGVVENIDRSLYDVTLCGISKSNNWYVFNDSYDLLDSGDWLKSLNNEFIDNIMRFVKQFDVIFPIIHGKLGEDGSLSSLFDMLGVKYVGSGSLSHGIGLDKHFTKLLCNSNGILQTDYVVIDKNEKKYVKLCEEKLDYPMIVKPNCGGSSIGINVVYNRKGLSKAILHAREYDCKVIVESFEDVREFECAVLEDKNIITSSIGEILPSSDFYDYEAKYESDTKVVVGVVLNDDLSKRIKDISIKVFNLLGCKDLARIDFLYNEKRDKLYFNEINTIPGFTEISMYPKLFEKDGISYKELISKLIENNL